MKKYLENLRVGQLGAAVDDEEEGLDGKDSFAGQINTCKIILTKKQNAKRTSATT